jgi:hypothetical protein
MTDDEVLALIERIREPGEDAAAELAFAAAVSAFTPSQAAIALRATSQPFPREHDYDDRAGAIILHVVATHARPELVAVLDEVMPALDPQARAEAVRVAGQIHTPEAYDFMIRSLETYLPDEQLVPDWSGVLYWLEREPDFTEVVFPRLLELRTYPALRTEVDVVIGAYHKAGLLSAEVVASASPAISAILRSVKSSRRSVEKRAAKGESRWWRDPRYQEQRQRLAASVRALSYVEQPKVEAELAEVSRLGDPLLRLAALSGRVRSGAPVDDEVLDELVSDDETRLELFELLMPDDVELSRADHVSRADFATSYLIRWLGWPGELGHPPVETNFIATVPTVEDGQPVEYEVIGFRPTSKDNDQFAAVVGPYATGSAPHAEPDLIFSDFEPVGTASAEQHLARIIGRLNS